MNLIPFPPFTIWLQRQLKSKFRVTRIDFFHFKSDRRFGL